ncbi:MAG TPA: hypothetical protein GXZ47_02845 [Treponema sp.]|nr:hypothetical protein [Treponema sp.]
MDHEHRIISKIENEAIFS